MASFLLDGEKRRTRNWAYLVVIGISFLMAESTASFVLAASPGSLASDMSAGAAKDNPTQTNLESQPTPSPGYSNGNLAYLSAPPPGGEMIASPQMNQTPLFSGCTGRIPGIVSFQASPTMGNPPLVVAFSVETLCGGSVTWTFGDGNVSSQSVANGSVNSGFVTYYWWNYTHTYHFMGSFVAQFLITSGIHRVSETTNIYAGSVGGISFQVSPQFGSPPLSVGFSYETVFGAGYSTSWIFGDGNASTQTSPNGSVGVGGLTYQWWNYTHNYQYTGTFHALVNVSWTKFHALAAANITSSWVQAGSFQASPNFGNPPLAVSFGFGTTYGVGYSATWTWGDGNVSTQSNPNSSGGGGGSPPAETWGYSHTYHYLGSFIPEVTVSKASHHVSATTNVYASFVPSLFYSFYNESGLISQGINGSSSYAIGLNEECSVSPSNLATFTSDLQVFDRQFGLSTPSVTFKGPGASSCPSPTSGFRPETDLDIQWAHVAAPGAKIYVYLDNQGTQTPAGLELGIQTFDQNSGKTAWNTMIESNSWSYCAIGQGYDPQLKTNLCTNTYSAYQYIEGAAQSAGMTLFSSSGDTWPSLCDSANYPASDPWGIAVGATTVTGVGSTGSYGSEAQWLFNTQPGICSLSSGGQAREFSGEMWGANTLYPAPSWQTQHLSSSRYFPDVSLVGNVSTGVPIVSQGLWIIAGGDSVGAPTWAGILDVLFQAAAPGLSGFAGWFLYNATSCFHPVQLIQGSARDGLGSPDIGCLSKK